jgi:hypothetical protein
VALEYDARHSPTRRPIPKDSAARRVILLYYGGPAMEGPGLTGNTSQELSVGGLLVQSSPSDGCILEHLGYSGAPQYCLYSSRGPAARQVRKRRAADSKNRYPTPFQGFCPRGSSPLPDVTLSSDIFIRNGWNKLRNVQRKCIKLTLSCC